MNKVELGVVVFIIVIMILRILYGIVKVRLVAIIYYVDGRVVRHNHIFESWCEYDDWVDKMFKDNHNKIDRIEYKIIKKKL